MRLSCTPAAGTTRRGCAHLPCLASAHPPPGHSSLLHQPLIPRIAQAWFTANRSEQKGRPKTKGWSIGRSANHGAPRTAARSRCRAASDRSVQPLSTSARCGEQGGDGMHAIRTKQAHESCCLSSDSASHPTGTHLGRCRAARLAGAAVAAAQQRGALRRLADLQQRWRQLGEAGGRIGHTVSCNPRPGLSRCPLTCTSRSCPQFSRSSCCRPAVPRRSSCAGAEGKRHRRAGLSTRDAACGGEHSRPPFSRPQQQSTSAVCPHHQAHAAGGPEARQRGAGQQHLAEHATARDAARRVSEWEGRGQCC